MRRAGARLRARLAVCDDYDMAVVALLAILVALAVFTAGSYAVSNDEPVQQRYGELIVAYYASAFTDLALFHLDNLHLYGGLFDLAAVLVQSLLPWADAYTVRHLLCALIGIGGIGAAAATARLVAGPRAGALAAFTLAACGVWYGAMFNHTKDIPFAAAMMGATYFLMRMTRALPAPHKGDVIGFGVLLGAALGIRVLGLLMVGYACIAMLTEMLQRRERTPRERLRFFARSAIAFVPAFVIAYVIMIVTWPWSALSPLNPIRGLIAFGEFHYRIYTLLAGRIYEMGDVPRWYVPTYLVIKLPLAMIGGAVCAIALAALHREDARRRLEIALLTLVAVFPVLCEVIDHGPAFTGMRHFLFVVPVVAVLAGVGFDGLMGTLAGRRILQAAAASAVVAALVWNAAMLVRLHPYQYLFYNPLVGGLEGAARRYATDYWVNIMPEAVADLEAYVDKFEIVEDGRPYTVGICGERRAFERETDGRLQWTDDWETADFFIAPTHMDCDRVVNGTTVATITRLGVPIGVVKDRRALARAAMARRH
jgi:hypothetical protein